MFGDSRTFLYGGTHQSHVVGVQVISHGRHGVRTGRTSARRHDLRSRPINLRGAVRVPALTIRAYGVIGSRCGPLLNLYFSCGRPQSLTVASRFVSFLQCSRPGGDGRDLDDARRRAHRPSHLYVFHSQPHSQPPLCPPRSAPDVDLVALK